MVSLPPPHLTSLPNIFMLVACVKAVFPGVLIAKFVYYLEVELVFGDMGACFRVPAPFSSLPCSRCAYVIACTAPNPAVREQFLCMSVTVLAVIQSSSGKISQPDPSSLAELKKTSLIIR